MNDEKVTGIDAEILNKGKYLLDRLKLFMQLLEKEVNHEKLPKRLQEMAKNGLEISTTKNFAQWYEFLEEVRVKVEGWTKSPDNLDQPNFVSTINEWIEIFQKLLSFINQVPTRALELLNKRQTKEDVNKIFIKDGKPLVKEFIIWSNRLLGKEMPREHTGKKSNLEANLGISYFKAVHDSKWAIEIIDIKKRYGTLEAVKELSLTIKKGEIFGLLGPNGAGKTTLIECIEGIRRPDTGDIFVLGHSYTGAEKLIKEKIGVQLQAFGYYETLTIKEVLKLYASFFQLHRDIDEIIGQLELEAKARTRVKHLSGGQLQRLALATAMVNDPEVIFLDEPTTGLDPHGRRNMWGIIQGLRDSGKTIFLTTHYMEEAEFLCSRVGIMHEGRIIEIAPPNEMIEKHTNEKTIVVDYKGTIKENDIKQLQGVTDFWVKDSRITITSRDHKNTLTGLLEWNTPGITIDDITIRRGNLEDVFLKLTDRGLDQ